MKSIINETKQFVPNVAFDTDHPEMLIGTPARDKRLDVPDSCEYAVNDETHD